MTGWSFLSTLTWVLFLVYLLKKYENKITLEKLSKFIEKIKYGKWEIFIKQGIDEVSKISNSIGDSIKNDSEVEKSFNELSGLKNHDKILKSWSLIEKYCDLKLQQLMHKPHEENRTYSSPYVKLLYTGIFIPEFEVLLDKLRVLKFQIGNIENEADIGTEFTSEYLNAAKKACLYIQNITSIPSVNLHALTSIIYVCQMLIDKKEHISIEEILTEIENDNLINFLNEKYKNKGVLINFNDIDSHHPGFKTFYNRALKSLNNAYGHKIRKKFGIENNGLCLIVSWTTEIIAMGGGWHPNEDWSEN